MGRYFWSIFCFPLALLVLMSPKALQAYIPSLSNSGVPIRWKSPFKLNLAGNPANQSGLGAAEVFHDIVTCLQRWKDASLGTVNFDYWQGSDASTYIPSSEYKGLSRIYFASNAAVDPHLSANILGMTQVWYKTDTGDILETDIVLNDRDFYFTDNPMDTSGYGAGINTFTNGKSKVFIQNVITHEMGHTLGLSHSGTLQSTMLFTESPEQAHLGCDERIAVHALYPSAQAGVRGSIQGSVLTEGKAPVFGAHVLAISILRGTVLATSITNSKGQFTIQALEPGPYYLLAEPFYAGSQTLPGYYSNSTSMICPKETIFSRTFLLDKDNFHLTPVRVSPHSISTAPPLEVHCNSTGGAAIPSHGPSNTFKAAVSIYRGNDKPAHFGIVDRVRNSKSHYYRLSDVQGHLKLHVLSYSLYSPVHPTLTLLDAEGNPVLTDVLDPAYMSDSGFINRDTSLEVDHLPKGDYLVQIRPDRLHLNNFPAGPLSLDNTPFILINGTLDEEEPSLSALLPNNVRCRAQETFPNYFSPPGPPPRYSNPILSSGGGCGTIQFVDPSIPLEPKSKPKLESNQSQLIIGWILPWLLAFGIVVRMKIRIRV